MEHEDQPQHMLGRVMRVGQLLASAEGRELDKTPGQRWGNRVQPKPDLDDSAAERKNARTYPDEKG